MEDMDDIKKCFICAETFRDPRILPCLHTFCLKCLEETSMRSDEKPADTVHCPLCRQHFDIPLGTLDGIKKNFFVERLLQIANVSKPIQNRLSCDVCLACADDATTELADASKYCIECRENLCETCSLHHNRQKLSRSHQVVLYGSPVKELAKRFVAQFCDQHDMEQLKMYCTDCKKMICIVCFAESHQLHKCCDVNRVAESLRSEIETDIEKVVETFNDCAARKRELHEQKMEFLEGLDITEKAISDRANNLKKFVDDHTKSLLDELAALKSRQLSEIETKQEKIDSYLSTIQSVQSYWNEVKSKGTPCDICCYAIDLHARGEYLRSMHKTDILLPTSSIKLSFEASKLEESVNMENIVGCIKVHNVAKDTKLKTKEETQQVNLISRLGVSSAIRGMTKLLNKIYVLYGVVDLHDRLINTIDVFEDQRPFQLVKKVEEKDIQNYRDIISTDKLKCLFVSDTWNRCILKVTVDDYRVTRWLSKVGESFALSISIDGYLLVLRNDQPSSKLEFYGSDAKLAHSTTLSSDIVCPVHVTQIQSGQFFIIHRLSDANRGPWIISQLSSDGMVTRQFSPKEESEIIRCPCDLSVDYDNNIVFVADSENHNVIELDLNSLHWLRIVLTRKQNALCNPQRLHYDVHQKQLIIAHSNKLDIYEIIRSD